MSEKKFTGFSEAGLQFLKELAQNNNKAWFDAHKKAYQTDLLAPAVAFVSEMGSRLQMLVPDLRVDTRTNGSGSLMRIYRDTRFSPDKTPYKTAVSALFWQGPGKKTEHPAFGFHLDREGMRLMAGQFVFTKAQLAAYRQAVVDEAVGAAFVAAIKAVRQSGPYDIAGKHYKRTPRGFDPAHQRADWLLFNGLYAHPQTIISPHDVTSPQIVDVCFDHFQKMAPIQQWLAKTLP